MANASNAHEEPNLVPLLDLVLQLVMFFMICANFVMQQVDTNILLPVAQSAKPAPPKQENSDILYLNINSNGQLLVLGRPQPLTLDDEIEAFLKSNYEDAKRRSVAEAHRLGGDADAAEVQTLVILRAHRDADYAGIYRVLRKCQEVGLRKMQLRTLLSDGR